MSQIDLNEAITNKDGKLKFKKNGNFMASSKCIFLEGTLLYALCKNLKGEWVESSIELNEGITNDNGVLKLD